MSSSGLPRLRSGKLQVFITGFFWRCTSGFHFDQHSKAEAPANFQPPDMQMDWKDEKEETPLPERMGQKVTGHTICATPYDNGLCMYPISLVGAA